MERHDHITWSDDFLFSEFERLVEHRQNVKMSGERLRQMQRDLARVVFEINSRALEEPINEPVDVVV